MSKKSKKIVAQQQTLVNQQPAKPAVTPLAKQGTTAQQDVAKQQAPIKQQGSASQPSSTISTTPQLIEKNADEINALVKAQLTPSSAAVDEKEAKKTNKELKAFAEFLIKDSKRLLKKHPEYSAHALREIREAKENLEELLENKRLNNESVERLNQLLEFHFTKERKSLLRDNVESIAFALLLALFIRAFFFEAFVIPSGSMIPSLAVNDFIFVKKFSYGIVNPFTGLRELAFSEPSRGDIVIFSYPCDPKLDYIKRAIALPGDTVTVDPHGFVYINGVLNQEKLVGEFQESGDFQAEALSAPNASCRDQKAYLFQMDKDKPDEKGFYHSAHSYHTVRCSNQLPSSQQSQENAFDWASLGKYQICNENAFFSQLPPFPWKVPEGHIFVMGDNREGSSDSRYWGFVPMNRIKGKAGMIWFSYNGNRKALVRFERLFDFIHGQVNE